MKTIGRNDPCWCGSGLKYKKCHLNRSEEKPMKIYEADKIFQNEYKKEGNYRFTAPKHSF